MSFIVRAKSDGERWRYSRRGVGGSSLPRDVDFATKYQTDKTARKALAKMPQRFATREILQRVGGIWLQVK